MVGEKVDGLPDLVGVVDGTLVGTNELGGFDGSLEGVILGFLAEGMLEGTTAGILLGILVGTFEVGEDEGN